MRDLVIDILKVVAPFSVRLIVFAQALGIAPNLVVTYFEERSGLSAGSVRDHVHCRRDGLPVLARKEPVNLLVLMRSRSRPHHDEECREWQRRRA